MSRRVRQVAVAAAVHVLLLSAVWSALEVPGTIRMILGDRDGRRGTERIRYATVAPSVPATTSRARPARAAAAAPPATAPSVPRPAPVQPPVVTVPDRVPTGIAPPRPSGPATGPLAPGHPAARGIQPAYTEPRIWIEAPIVTAPPLEGDARLDSAVASSIQRFQDSLVAAGYEPGKFERGDWTWSTKDGKKFGVDRQFIRLGNFSIPTALLGLLPLNVQTNPVAYDREKRLAAMRVEIVEHAQVAMNEEEFRRAVRAIRDRKEKERKSLLEKKKKEDAARVITSPDRSSY